MKPKVYLAKSNASDPDLVANVRKYLLAREIELVEFSGGTYSHKQLNGCDYLVIVPSKPDSYSTTIGKGLFEQIDYFWDHFDRHGNMEGNPAKRILFVADSSIDPIRVCPIREYPDSYEFNQRDWGISLETTEEKDLKCYFKSSESLEKIKKRFVVTESFGQLPGASPGKKFSYDGINIYYVGITEGTLRKVFYLDGPEKSIFWDRPDGFGLMKQEVKKSLITSIFQSPEFEETFPEFNNFYKNRLNFEQIYLDISKFEPIVNKILNPGGHDQFKANGIIPKENPEEEEKKEEFLVTQQLSRFRKYLVIAAKMTF